MTRTGLTAPRAPTLAGARARRGLRGPGTCPGRRQPGAAPATGAPATAPRRPRACRRARRSHLFCGIVVIDRPAEARAHRSASRGSNIKVVVRIRPVSKGERSRGVAAEEACAARARLTRRERRRRGHRGVPGRAHAGAGGAGGQRRGRRAAVVSLRGGARAHHHPGGGDDQVRRAPPAGLRAGGLHRDGHVLRPDGQRQDVHNVGCATACASCVVVVSHTFCVFAAAQGGRRR